MVLPIYAYGTKVLKRKAGKVAKELDSLDSLISDMWDTMYNASGVGLAAPQVGKSLRIFIVDTTQLSDREGEPGIKQVFINPEKIEEDGDLWSYEEGCLSIPDIRGDVDRPEQITLRYQDEQFKEHEEVFTDVEARVIQHEYDHLEGVLFTEKLKPVRKRRVRRRLDHIKKGQVEVSYPMRFS